MTRTSSPTDNGPQSRYRLGHYDVPSSARAGTGQVYRATDTQLNETPVG